MMATRMKKERTYQITVTKKQARILSEALSVFARLGIGQFRDVFADLPLDKTLPGWSHDIESISNLLSRYYTRQCAVSGNSKKVAWDLYQVLRQRLAWDDAVEEGIVETIGSSGENPWEGFKKRTSAYQTRMKR